MNIGKTAFLSAACLIIGAAALPGLSFAADSAAKKPASSQPAAEPAAHDMAGHDMAAHDTMAQGEEQPGGGGCCGQMGGGMMCDQMGGQMGGCMTGDQKGGMKCDHKGGMMGGQMGGMKCAHQGGMGGQMGGQMGGMKCDHKGGMMGGHKGGMMGHDGAGMMMGSAHMHMIMSLDLSDEQRSKINKLSDELKRNNLATKGSIMDESAKLRDLYAADKRDPSAIGKEYQKIFDLERKMIVGTITTQNRIEEILTAEQRAQLKSMRKSGAPMHDHPMH